MSMIGDAHWGSRSDAITIKVNPFFDCDGITNVLGGVQMIRSIWKIECFPAAPIANTGWNTCKEHDGLISAVV